MSNLEDGIIYPEEIGPVFKAKDFTQTIKIQAEHQFIKMRILNRPSVD